MSESQIELVLDGADASAAIDVLRSMLVNREPGLRYERAPADPFTQDAGGILVVLLTSHVVAQVVRGIFDFVARENAELEVRHVAADGSEFSFRAKGRMGPSAENALEIALKRIAEDGTDAE